MSDETVTITKERYKELLHSEKVLSALYDGGVDNWEWYEEALSSMDDDDD